MATGAAELMFRCVFDRSISMHDMDIERRPYHHNCNCALHKQKGVCSCACPQQRSILFPKKQSWTSSSLSVTASKFSFQSFLSNLSIKNKEDSNGALHIDDGSSLEA